MIRYRAAYEQRTLNVGTLYPVIGLYESEQSAREAANVAATGARPTLDPLTTITAVVVQDLDRDATVIHRVAFSPLAEER